MVHTRRSRAVGRGQMLFALGAVLAAGAAVALFGPHWLTVPELSAGLVLIAAVGARLRGTPRDLPNHGNLGPAEARPAQASAATDTSSARLLACLSAVDEVCATSPDAVDGVLAALVELLPTCWPTRAVTYVEIDIGDRVFSTGGMLRGSADAELELGAPGRVIGSIRVAGDCADPLPVEDSRLLSLIATRIGCHLHAARLVAAARDSERLELALEGSGLGLWEYDCRTGATRCCARCAAMLGYSEGQTDSETWARSIHREDVLDTLATFNAHVRGQTPWSESEYRIRAADGQWRWIRTRGRVAERGEDGQPVRIVGTCEDISQRRRARWPLLQPSTRRATHWRAR